MNIKRMIAATVTAAFVLSLTACANNETPKENSGGTGNEGAFSNSIPFIADGEEHTIWNVLPEIPVTDASAFKYEYDSELEGMIVTDYLNESPKVRIPDTLEGKPVVGVDLNDCQKELTELIMPDSVKSYSFSDAVKKDLQYVNVPRGSDIAEGFSYCKSLTNVFIPDGVTEIGVWAFSGCKSLASVTIPDSVTSIRFDAFRYCASLTSVTIPDSVTEIGVFAFSGTSLTSVIIPDSMTEISGSSFFNCTSLTSVTIPDGVTKIGLSVFRDCTSLTSVTIPDSVTEIGIFAFSGCTCLTSMTIPDGVTEIEGRVFQNCESLTSVIIPDSVTEIGEEAFYRCTSLTSITIPDGVTKIRKDAFNECTGIQASYQGETYDYEHIEDLYKAINNN